MPVTLSIEFSGLCLYLIHPDRPEIGIALPDARLIPDGKDMTLPDGEMGVPHVGYLRYNLADTGVDVPRGEEDGAPPRYEVLHRFDGEELDLGLLDGERKEPVLAMPEFPRIAPGIVPIPNMFTKPPATLLMRMRLKGGQLTSDAFDDNWHFHTVLNPNPENYYSGKFAGYSTWTRTIEDASSITLRITKFGGDVTSTIELTPSNGSGVINLKIGNLCAVNPVEWPDLQERVFTGRYDNDFRWLYLLMQHHRGSWADITGAGRKFLLPVPILDGGSRLRGEEPPDCTGAKITYPFT